MSRIIIEPDDVTKILLRSRGSQGGRDHPQADPSSKICWYLCWYKNFSFANISFNIT
jgi:hypothetical protein